MELTQARDLAIKLMIQHGLSDYSFKFDNACKRFGCCNYSKKKITLSKKLTEINNVEIIKDTLLHEIAHGIAGIGHGHDNYWRSIATRIGCNGNRCYGNEVLTPEKPFVGTCPKCGREIKRHRRTELSCCRCCKKYNNNKFSEEFVFVWTRNKNLTK